MKYISSRNSSVYIIFNTLSNSFRHPYIYHHVLTVFCNFYVVLRQTLGVDAYPAGYPVVDIAVQLHHKLRSTRLSVYLL